MHMNVAEAVGPVLTYAEKAPLLYNTVPPAPLSYLLYIPSVIRFRFIGRRSLLQSALRRFILLPLALAFE